MSELHAALALVVVALAGTAVVLASDPKQQAMILSFFGISLSLVFVTLGAPDVALSQIAVGSAILPMLILLTLAKTSEGRR